VELLELVNKLPHTHRNKKLREAHLDLDEFTEQVPLEPDSELFFILLKLALEFSKVPKSKYSFLTSTPI
jgi:hypothetical protein